MASNTNTVTGSNKLRILLIPIFATSHIQPFTELAMSLAEANDVVEATVAVTPANVSIVRSLLDRHSATAAVKIATYPFPTVDGLPKGVENFGTAATPDQSLCIMVASMSEALTRPAQETLIRAQSPDAIITDMSFLWNTGIAEALGVPCVVFSVNGAFSMVAMHHLEEAAAVGNNKDDDDDAAAAVMVPRFPDPAIRIPRSELPDFLRRKESENPVTSLFSSLHTDCFGLAMNTSSQVEKRYCEMYMGEGYVKRAYFLGPLALGLRSSPSSSSSSSPRGDSIMDWLESKPNRSVVYISFGSMAHLKGGQLDELAVGLETSGQSFLWVVRGKEMWSPPNGWEERVKDRGLIVRAWAPQRAILGHQAVGAFVMQCGWNSISEAVAAGVPLLTWPIAYEQFITERLVTDVLEIGERLWPGRRSERFDEQEVIPGKDVARALARFMAPGGPADAARTKVKDLAAKVHAAVAQGGSSHRDLHRLVDDLLIMAAKRT